MITIISQITIRLANEFTSYEQLEPGWFLFGTSGGRPGGAAELDSLLSGGAEMDWAFAPAAKGQDV